MSDHASTIRILAVVSAECRPKICKVCVFFAHFFYTFFNFLGSIFFSGCNTYDCQVAQVLTVSLNTLQHLSGAGSPQLLTFVGVARILKWAKKRAGCRCDLVSILQSIFFGLEKRSDRFSLQSCSQKTRKTIRFLFIQNPTVLGF
jgi:hypothetical protein